MNAHRRRNITLAFDSLESLTLLSSVAPVGHAIAAAVSLTKAVVLDVTLSGSYSAKTANSDTGLTYSFVQYGSTKALGDFGVTGSITTPNLGAVGHASGTLTFLTSNGTLTVLLTGPKQKGLAALPTSFTWKITAGTDGFSGGVGNGTVTVYLRVATTGLNASAGTATLTFHTNGK